jgi:molybdopterin molybdotransferase
MDIGALAALGLSEVEVYIMPSVYIISTGDEIVNIDATIKIGQIRDINTYAIGSLNKKIRMQYIWTCSS